MSQLAEITQPGTKNLVSSIHHHIIEENSSGDKRFLYVVEKEKTVDSEVDEQNMIETLQNKL